MKIRLDWGSIPHTSTIFFKSKTKTMAKTKIQWSDFTWNPVWGCKFSCSFCYARNISNRFASIMAEKNAIFDWNDGEMFDFPYGDYIDRNMQEIEGNLKEFKPTFLGYNFEYGIDEFKLLNKNGFPKKSRKRIFVGSMSDIAFWKDEWIEKIVKKIKSYPFNTFQLLTKAPEIYKKLDDIMPHNVWFGTTITQQMELRKTRVFADMSFGRIKYVSFEPLLSDIKNEKIKEFNKNPLKHKTPIHKPLTYFDYIDWIIIGTMSGRKRTPAKNEWMKNIINEAEKFDIPVFVKQIELNGKVEKDISNFPKGLQFQNFPKS